MKSEDVNRKIAELCGWAQVDDNRAPMLGVPILRGYPPKGALVGRKQPIPDYWSSLDACREFERTIKGGACESGWTTYITHIVGPHLANDRMKFGAELRLAAPWKLCQAFLRVHNQWEGE